MKQIKIERDDPVNNPQHYGGKDNPYEVIKVCEAWELDKDAYLFNVVKYVARAGKKDQSKELEVYVTLRYPDIYDGGIVGLKIEWIPEGSFFRVNEHCGRNF